MLLKNSGFTLVEMAVVIVIIGVLLATIAVPISAQIDMRNRAATLKILEEAKEVVIGFVLLKGRLPCTAGTDPTLLGNERPDPATGYCSRAYNDLLPGTTLGLQGDSSGYVLDGWGHRLNYLPDPNLSKKNAVIKDQISSFSEVLYVCSQKDDLDNDSGSLDRRCKKTTALDAARAKAVAFIIHSTGKNGLDESIHYSNTDEFANGAASQWAVMQLDPGTAINGWDIAAIQQGGGATTTFAKTPTAYDDLMVYVSVYELYARMVAAGKAP